GGVAGGLVTAQAIAENRAGVAGEVDQPALAARGRLLGGALDQRGGLRLPAAPGRQRRRGIGDRRGPRRPPGPGVLLPPLHPRGPAPGRPTAPAPRRRSRPVRMRPGPGARRGGRDQSPGRWLRRGPGAPAAALAATPTGRSPSAPADGGTPPVRRTPPG